MVNPPASTGRLSRSNQLVTSKHQGNRGIEKIRAKVFCLHIVVVQIKFIEPNMLPIPAECRLRITMSTLGPEWLRVELRGG